MKKSIQYACHTVLLSALIGAGAVTPVQAAPKQAEKAVGKAAAKPGAKTAPNGTARATSTAAAPVAAPASQAAQKDAVFARIGDTVITFAEYDNAFTAAARSKFYHGRAPERDVAALQRTVAQDLVSRVLLVKEAKKRGIQPDEAAVKKMIDAYEERYAKSEQWKKNRETILPLLTAALEEGSLLEQFEKIVRAVPDPEVAAVRAYYEANPEKFTEPERVRVSLILIPVPPTSMAEEWDKAAETMTGVLKQIRDGADFGEMAKANSKAQSAAQGGDMGYQHKGILPEPVQELLATLKVGEVSEVLRLLEGVGLMKLTDRIEAKKHDFERVQQRASDLLKRDNADAAWEGLKAELRKGTQAEIDESRFLPMVADNAGDSAAPK